MSFWLRFSKGLFFLEKLCKLIGSFLKTQNLSYSIWTFSFSDYKLYPVFCMVLCMLIFSSSSFCVVQSSIPIPFRWTDHPHGETFLILIKTRCDPVLRKEIVGLHSNIPQRISDRRLPIYVDCETLTGRMLIVESWNFPWGCQPRRQVQLPTLMLFGKFVCNTPNRRIGTYRGGVPRSSNVVRNSVSV